MKIVFELELLKRYQKPEKKNVKIAFFFCGDHFKSCVFYILFPLGHDEEFFFSEIY